VSEKKAAKRTQKGVSRRERPSKPGLSREGIVDTALDLLASGGMSGLSLRKVAAELDTGAASLYVYVANLRELYALMLDRAVGEVAIPDETGGDWRERLSFLLVSYTRCLLSRSGMGRLAVTTMSSGTNMLRLAEAIAALLQQGGVVSPRMTLAAMDTLLLHASAIAAEQDAWRDWGNPLGAMEQALKDSSPEQFPHLQKLGEALAKESEERGADRLRESLEMLIDGVLQANVRA